MGRLVIDELTGTFRTVPFEVAFLRIIASLILAGLIGAEREWRRKPAGLRIHMLVSLAACLYAIVGREIASADLLGAGDNLRVDPMNLIGAVTAGVAFLVAGIIITSGGKVHNITTGASLWLAGAIGLTCGVGKIPLSVLTTAVVLIVLVTLAAFVRQENQDD